MPLKSSYKSSSTNSLYEFAEELAQFDKTDTRRRQESKDKVTVQTNNNDNTEVAYSSKESPGSEI